MENKEFEEVIGNLADKAKLAQYNDLAIVLYTFLGSKKAGVSSDFARHCQSFARQGIKEIDANQNRRNN